MSNVDVTPASAAAESWESPRRLRFFALIVATVGAVVLSLLLAAPFLTPITGALALAIVFAPFHRWLEARVRHPNFAALITVFLIVLIVIIPLALISGRLFGEASHGATLIKAKVDSGEWVRLIEGNPRIAPIARWIQTNTDLPGAIATAASWLTAQGAVLVRGSVMQLVDFLITFYVLFFFLRDRRQMLESLRALSPLSKSATDKLCTRVADTIHATIYGTLAIAVVKGILGGLMFWWLGLPAALLWGVVMGLLAVVPMVGAFIVWIPAAIFLAAEGSWIKALILTIWGTIAIGGIDNVLYPILIGNRLKLHTLLMFISVVGGLIVFGVTGFILGPVVMGATLTLIEVWREDCGPAER